MLAHRRAGRSIPAVDRGESKGRPNDGMNSDDWVIDVFVESSGLELGMLILNSRVPYARGRNALGLQRCDERLEFLACAEAGERVINCIVLPPSS